MLRLTVDLNGRVLAEIAVHNTGEERVAPDDTGVVETKYDVYDLYDDDIESFDGAEMIGSVWHWSPEGASTLVDIVTDEIDLADHFR